MASLRGWRSQTWPDRARSAFATLKRRSPRALKALYYRRVSPSTVRRLAQTTMLPVYDWRRTRAFALPSDQHGWVRINLEGREASGAVRPADYEATCEELAAAAASLRDADGRPLTERVIRTSRTVDDAMRSPLPDVVVHWSDAALASPLRIAGSRIVAHPIGRKFTGQHALDGFCVWRGPAASDTSETIPATDLRHLLSV
jgi:predicted AlkP superfamily phosphohydrolase/phosphomutase